MAIKTKQKNNNDSELKPQKVSFVKQEIPTIYVNHAQIGFSNFDAAIMVGEIAGQKPNGDLDIYPRAKLMMSREFLVVFADLIYRNLELLGGDEALNQKVQVVLSKDPES